MGQEDEATNETLDQIRREHHSIKTWYNDDNNNNNNNNTTKSELKSKYGNFPTFWQDVIKWNGYKETWKLYWRDMEQGNKNSQPQPQQDNSNNDGGERKRKSRWSSAKDNGDSSSNKTDAVVVVTPLQQQPPPPTEEQRKPRRSRWSSTNPNQTTNNSAAAAATASTLKPTAATGILGLLPGIPQGMTQEQLFELSELQKRVKFVNGRLNNLEAEAARVDSLPRGSRDRSPSPPPMYGADGVRTNTRAVRWREKYSLERQDCLEKIMELNPSLRPPGFIKRKRTKKIHIPVDDHPSYNFIGLIIGPRGKTQKEMENKTGCKIAIRGRGSVKEGARGRRDGRPMEGDDEPLHVVITGDDQVNVDKAGQMINDMLVVIDDEKNIHKQQQLRELALLNGTLKDEEYCHLCAEKGHRSFECPKRFNTTNSKKVSVKCAICGDTSHPTRDCAQKTVDMHQVDQDYLSFMAELDGKKSIPATVPETTPELPPTATLENALETKFAAIPPPPGLNPSAITALPPTATMPATTTTETIAPVATATTALPTSIPPPAVPPQLVQQPYNPQLAAAYQQQLQQQMYPQNPYAAYQQPYAYPPQQQVAPHMAQQPPPSGQNVDDLTEGWDYTSFYGASGSNNENVGAGGFQWWDQNP